MMATISWASGIINGWCRMATKQSKLLNPIIQFLIKYLNVLALYGCKWFIYVFIIIFFHLLLNRSFGISIIRTYKVYAYSHSNGRVYINKCNLNIEYLKVDWFRVLNNGPGGPWAPVSPLVPFTPGGPWMPSVPFYKKEINPFP